MKNNIALIGCGIWGKKILKDLIQLKCRVTVFELNEVDAAEIISLGAQELKTALPQDASFDGIIVATPSTTHRSVLEQIMHFNVPIFLEKPLTTRYTDALALQKIVHQDVYLMHVWLYHPGIQLLASVAQSGELGEVKGVRSTRANWTSPRKDTDSIWNLSPHDITITKAILGFIPKPQASVIEWHKGVARGMFALLGNQPFSIIEVSNRYERKIREVRVHGSDGVAILRDEVTNFIEIIKGDSESDAHTQVIEKRAFDTTPALYLELKEFVNYLNGGSAPRSNFAEGLEVIQVIDELITLAK